MKFGKSVIGLAVCGMCSGLPAQAVDFSQISINGFGSVIGGLTLDEDEIYFGNDDKLAFQQESRFALQFGAPIGDKWSATAQILARGSTNFDPRFEWAYIGYQFNDDLKFLFGRQRFKLYKYSDYLDVGYAYPWIRPPQGVYSLPFSSGDGVSAVYTTYTGDLEMTFTGAFQGLSNDEYLPSGSTTLNPAQLDIASAWLLSADFVLDSFNFGFNFAAITDFSYDVATANPALGGALVLIETGDLNSDGIPDVPPNPAAVEDVNVEEDEGLSYGVYFGYDPGNFFLLLEYSAFRYDTNLFSDADSYYATLGLRHGQWTFHATYGMDENEPSSDADTKLGAAAVASPALAAAIGQAIRVQVEDSTTTSVGFRYDIETGIAIKGDYTSYKNDEGLAPDADVISAGIDFVF